MRRSNLTHFALVLLLSVSNAMAQITDTQSGTDFADSVTAKMPALTKPSGFGAFDTPPATSAYSAANAKGSLGSLGSAAMQRCANYVPTGDPVKDQECAGVNYMANNCLQPNATQRQVISGTANAYTGSNNCKGSYGSGAGAFNLSSQDKSMITNFGTATASTAPQSCRTVTKIISPAVTQSYSCTKSSVYAEVNCTQELNPLCAFQGAQIKNGIQPQNQFGPIGYSITETGTAGLYNYSIWGGGNRTQAGVTLNFSLDTIGQGSYMTINLSNLDDAMAIGANNTTVFAGRPNSECNGGGPVNYFSFGDSGEYGSFQPGYSECWTAYEEQCVAWNYDEYWGGSCAQTQSVPVQRCVSGIKVANHCVRGTGGSLTCTGSGKMVYIPTEGCGTYSGSIPSSTIPLVAGQNNIQVWWGNWNAPWGDPSGQFNITGQIYNVAPVCDQMWINNCAPFEQAAGISMGNPQ